MDIPPHKVTQPFQLLASWLVGMLFLVWEFLYVCLKSTETWLKANSFMCAFLLSIIFIGVIFRLQTKYRPEMQDSEHYQQIWMEQMKKERLSEKTINMDDLINLYSNKIRRNKLDT